MWPATLVVADGLASVQQDEPQSLRQALQKRADRLRGLTKGRLSSQPATTGCGVACFLRLRAPGSSPASPLAQSFQDIPVQEGLRLFGTPEGTGRARRGYVQSSHLFGDSPDSEWASRGALTGTERVQAVRRSGESVISCGRAGAEVG
jgi:hypothetical protein